MIKWDSEGFLLASCADDDDAALLWSPASNDYLKSFKGHTNSINALRWSNSFPSSSNYQSGQSKPAPVLATASKDHTVRLWDVEFGKTIMTF